MTNLLSRLVRTTLPPAARRALRETLIGLAVPRVRPVAAWAPTNRITVAGLLRSSTGLGHGARQCALSLAALGYEVGTIDLTAAWGAAVDLPPLPYAGDAGGPLILHLNPPYYRRALLQLRRQIRARPLIGYWNWELAEVPASWVPSFDHVHQIWTPSRFTAEALGGRGVPLHIVPHLVDAPAEGALPDWAATPADTLLVLAVFSYSSGFDRKNPLGAVAAFRTAFGDRPDVRLIVKAGGNDPAPGERERMEAAVAGAGNITLHHGSLDAGAYGALMRRADIFLSLHRAEGFGIPLVEAMRLAKPVVATGWSSNLDFMNDEIGCLVPYDLVPVRDAREAYEGAKSSWADPRIDAAAAWLRQLQDPARRAAIGAASSAHVAAIYSTESYRRAAAAALAAVGCTPLKHS